MGTKKEVRAAYLLLIKAVHSEGKKLLKKGLYEDSLQVAHFIRSLQNVGVFLNVVK